MLFSISISREKEREKNGNYVVFPREEKLIYIYNIYNIFLFPIGQVGVSSRAKAQHDDSFPYST